MSAFQVTQQILSFFASDPKIFKAVLGAFQEISIFSYIASL